MNPLERLLPKCKAAILQIVLTVLIPFSFITCADDEKSYSECRLIEYKIVDNKTTWKYDDLGFIVELNEAWSGGVSNKCTYLYNGNKVTITCTDGNAYTYSFLANRLTEIQTTIPGSADVGITTYEYLSDKVVVTINRPWNNEVVIFTYIYDEAKENFTKQIRNEGAEVYEFDLRYDKSLNPFTSIMGPGNTDISMWGAKNLIVYDNVTIKQNKLGLPLSINSNGTISATYNYDCQ